MLQRSTACTAALLCFMLWPTLGQAREASLSRVAPNLYQEDGEPVVVHTDDCSMSALGEDVQLDSTGSGGTIRFEEDEECAVRHVLHAGRQKPGRFELIMSREASDWYEVVGQPAFIETVGCISKADLDEAYLIINPDGTRRLRFDDESCVVHAVYGQVHD